MIGYALRLWLPGIVTVLGAFIVAGLYVKSEADGRPALDLNSARVAVAKAQQTLRELQTQQSSMPKLPPLLLVTDAFATTSRACGLEVAPLPEDARLPNALIGYQGLVPRWQFSVSSSDLSIGLACMDLVVKSYPVIVESMEVTTNRPEFIVSVFGALHN